MTASNGSITIVTGTPGVGKTTLCRQLAAKHPRGVHVLGDDFFGYFAHPIPPVEPESREQNATALAAAARAANAYAEGGYTAYLDGIIGPWFIDHVLAQTGSCPIHYVILDCALERALAQGPERAEHPVDADIVRKMHGEFARAERFAAHRVDIGSLPVAGVYDAVDRALRAGRFRLR